MKKHERQIAISRKITKLHDILRDSAAEYIPPPLIDPPPGFMALDLETTDPTLKDIGSAWAFPGVGIIIGVAVAWEGFEAYYSVGHASGNYENQGALRDWLVYQLGRHDLTIVCAKASYDIGWLRRYFGFYPQSIVDVQHMAALIDENRFEYNLDALSSIYLQEHKDKTFMSDVHAQFVNPRTGKSTIRDGDIMANLALMPARLVAPYGAMDARLTFDLRARLQREIDRQGLSSILALESALIPMSVEMRRRGVRIDVKRAEALMLKTEAEMPALAKEIFDETRVHVEPWQNDLIGKALEAAGAQIKLTRTGKPEIRQPALEALAATVPVAAKIVRLRKLAKISGTFLKGLLEHANGTNRVHPEFNQLKGESSDSGEMGGTVARYSSSNPNFQQIPTRDPEFGKAFRSLILPEEGEAVASLDYSQQEPRLMIHYAAISGIVGADEAVKLYNENPKTDFHQMTADLCGLQRSAAKTIGLGLGYGMGAAKLARSLGLPTQWKMIVKQSRMAGRDKRTLEPVFVEEEVWRDCDYEDAEQRAMENSDPNIKFVQVAGDEAKTLLKAWRDGVPFIPGLARMCQNRVNQVGQIRTIGGRVFHFVKKHGEYQGIHKAMNRLIQGSAADQTKMAMLQMWKEGFIPMATIHDEVIISIKSEADALRIKEIMETALDLLVPSVVDVKYGATLGEVEK